MDALQKQLQSLPDSITIPCRGRDYPQDDWDYGFCTLQNGKLFFNYASGYMECFPILAVDFSVLVHLALLPPTKAHHSIHAKEVAPERLQPHGVAIIAHGWSPDVGPNYPLIRSLEAQAQRKGWQVIVPDFREIYKKDAQRGRSERVKLLFEELLCLEQPAPPVVFVGHSQGGAASANACSPRICQSKCWDIRGLFMLGSENPMTLDDMDWIPPVPNLHIVHAKGDRVIPSNSLRNCADHWRCKFTELTSSTAEGATDLWGDDINHDFLAPDLIQDVTRLFDAFLDSCLHEKPSFTLVDGVRMIC